MHGLDAVRKVEVGVSKLDVLRQSELFSSLTDEELKVIEKNLISEAFDPGAVICKQGKKLDKLYVIEDGLVGIIREVGPLAQRQVQSAAKFDVVGWSALVGPHICTATAKAIKKTKVLTFKREDMDRLCATRPDIGCKVSNGLARVVAKRLSEAYTQLLGVTSED